MGPGGPGGLGLVVDQVGVLGLEDLVGVPGQVDQVGVPGLVDQVGVLGREDLVSLGLVGFLVGVQMVYAAFYLHASTACVVVACSKIVSADTARAQVCHLRFEKKPTNLPSHAMSIVHFGFVLLSFLSGFMS
ncbi:hypothetical protein ACSQ67_001827 [Phaseolus vulgaris]